MKYKFIEHTADIKFQAFGKTKEKVFENAAYALKKIICKNQVKNRIRKKIKVKGRDKENLLYNFLEEFLYLLETQDFILSKIKNIKIKSRKKKNKQGKEVESYELIAETFFDNVKEKKYELETHVKAITYNDMFVKQEKIKNKKTWICQVVVDV